MPIQLKNLMYMAAGIFAVAVAARVSVPVPGSPVPQSLQTLAIVLVGVWMGPKQGGATLVFYLAVGALGLPVFADGASGPEHLWGPTGGYLAGFVAGGVFAGWAVREPWGEGAPGVVGAAIVAHLLILGLGWLRLATMLGVTVAFTGGVAPFLVGGLAKSVAAGAIWAGVDWARHVRSATPARRPSE